MEKIEVEVYSNATNSAIVRMPERQFPGIVIQGDSLSALLALAEDIANLSTKTSDKELVASTRELVNNLDTYLKNYEQALAKHGIPIPYRRNR